MPSKRFSATEGVVLAIRQANAVAPYTFDLSPAHVTKIGIELIESRLRLAYPASIRVWDGTQENELRELTTRREEARLEVIVSILLKDQSSDDMPKQLNLLIADVAHAIAQDQYLAISGPPNRAVLARVGVIDAPSYNPEQKYAHVTIHVGVGYSFDAMSEI